MDILDLIPSKDVREHVRKSGYKLTATDAVCIACHTNKVWNAQWAAYRDICDSMNNCLAPNGESLHKLISKYVKITNKLFDTLCEDDKKAYYNVYVMMISGSQDDKIIENLPTMKSCNEEIAKLPQKNIDFVRIEKIIGNKAQLIAEKNRDGGFVEIFAHYANADEQRKYDEIRQPILQCELSEQFPLPFEYGDIVCGENFRACEKWYGVFHKRDRNGAPEYGFFLDKGDKVIYEKTFGTILLSTLLVAEDNASCDYKRLKTISQTCDAAIAIAPSELLTLNRLISKLFKQYGLNPYVHFDVWICDYADEAQSEINRDEPLVCCHYEDYPFPEEATEIYKWLRFEVEDYEFEITVHNEYHLFVKLIGLPLVKSQDSPKMSSKFTPYPYRISND